MLNIDEPSTLSAETCEKIAVRVLINLIFKNQTHDSRKYRHYQGRRIWRNMMLRLYIGENTTTGSTCALLTEASVVFVPLSNLLISLFCRFVVFL